ncbi:unnamed protein product, partial [Heterosigma akashiwo]
VVKEGETLQVPLQARGTGTTMHSASDMRRVDFGHQFTNHVCERKITLENKGRRSQVLRWSNRTVRERLGERERAERAKQKAAQAAGGPGGGGGGAGKKKKEEEPIVPLFTVTPEEVELRPRTAIVFTFRGFVAQPGAASEVLVCESKVGKDKQAKVVFETEVCADFLHPLLEFSRKAFAFEYTYAPGVPLALAAQPLTMTNTGHLPVTFTLRAQVPFSVDAWEHSLAPGEAHTVQVEFDAGYRNDRASHRVEKQLTVAYSDHPQRDHLPLAAEVAFPNLEFETRSVAFGCVLNDTTKTVLVRVTNCSRVDTLFSWSFLEGEGGGGGGDDERSQKTGPSRGASRAAASHTGGGGRAPIPINQVFDILPIRSHLAPGESEDVEFLFYGHANRKFKGTCVCEVEGGPEYEVALSGDASHVGFKLDKPFLDFGRVLHTKTEDGEFHVLNPGKVAFPYKVRTDRVSLPGLLEVTPATGTVAAGDKQRVAVRFRPGVPQRFKETLVLEVAHFEPVELPVYGQGIYTAVALSLPRLDPLLPDRLRRRHPTPEWGRLLDAARRGLAEPDLELLPPGGDFLPAPPMASTATAGSKLGGAASELAGAGAAGMASGWGSSLGPSTAGPSGRTTRMSERPTSSVSLSPTRGGRRKGAAEGPLQLDVEMEANRLLYLAFLRADEAEKERAEAQLAEQIAGGAAGAAALAPQDRGSEATLQTLNSRRSAPPSTRPGTAASLDSDATGASRASARRKKPRALSKAAAGASSGAVGRRGFDLKHRFVVARHVADFGHIISGNSKRLVFRVTNASPTGPLSFSFDKNALAGTGFAVEPEKVVRLPENEAVTFTVSFVAKKSMELGFKELELPIEVKNGPPTLLLFKANVTVPEVAVSTDHLRFEPTFVGNSLTKCLQLHNVAPVAAQWDLMKAIGSARDEARFVATPRGGLLAPGAKVNVAVEFLPQDARVHALKVPLRVQQGLKAKNLLFEGVGQNTELVFKPGLAEMGPALPYGAPATCLVEMCNNSDRDIEVYSLDFDTEYLKEEEVLGQLSSYPEDDTLRLPVRRPGEGLPGARRRGAGAPAGRIHGLRAPRAAWEAEATARSEGRAQDAVVVGPPLSGKSTVAWRLGEKYGYPVLTVDGVLAAAAGVRSDLGAAVRAATGRFATEEERAAHAARVGALEAAVAEEAAQRAAAAEEAAKAKKKKKGQEEEEAPEPPSAAELELARLRAGGVSAEVLRAALEWRLGEADCGRGAVVDSWDSGFCSADVAAEALGLALPRARPSGYPEVEDWLPGGLARVAPEVEALVLKLDPPPPSPEEEEKPDPKAKKNSKAAVEPQPEEEEEKPPPTPPDMSNWAWATRLQDLLCEKFFEPTADEAYFAQLVPVAAAFEEEPDLLKVVSRPGTGMRGSLESIEEHLGAKALEGKAGDADGKAKEGGGKSASDKEDPDQRGLEGLPPEGMMRRLRLLLVDQVPSDGVDLLVTAALAGLAPPEVPPPDPRALPVPEPKERQLVRRPARRAQRAPLPCFRILPSQRSYTVPGNPFRWVVAARGSVFFQVEFTSRSVGRFDAAMGFEVVGAKREISLFNLGVCDVPQVSADPRNVFMRRAKHRAEGAPPASRKFVVSRGVYEFGPLLTWKEPALMEPPAEGDDEAALLLKQTAAETNCETLRLTNSGRFPAKLRLGWETSMNRREASKPEKGAKGGGDPQPADTFVVEPAELELEIGETKEVRVWAFPRTLGAHADQLVICVQDNPHPVTFPFTALGVDPELELQGPWPGEAPGVEPLLDFDRLLLGRSEQQEFALRNPTHVPVVWRLDLAALEGLAEFRLTPTEGTVAPGGAARVSVFFNALADAEFEKEVGVEYADPESGFEVAERVRRAPLKLRAEAYRIKAVAFEEEDGSNDNALNFGTVRARAPLPFVGGPLQSTAGYIYILRVGEEKVEHFGLRNLGKYDITFDFRFRRPAVERLLLVEPRAGRVGPGERVEVAVLFVSEREVRLRDNKDLSCLIAEPHTGEVIEEFQVAVTAQSAWSTFRLQPARGLNFGALAVDHGAAAAAGGEAGAGAAPRSRKFELKNQGTFDFVFLISAEQAHTPAALRPGYRRKEWIHADPSEAAAAAEEPAGATPNTGNRTGKSEKPSTSKKDAKKGGDKKGGTAGGGGATGGGGAAGGEGAPPVPEEPREIGHFRVTPAGGVVHPGQSVAVEVEFLPQGKNVYKEYLALQVSGANAEDQVYQQALHYEMVGESCEPGIGRSDWRSIFEEQAVIPSVAEGFAGAASEKAKKDLMATQVFFAEAERLFSFGSVVCQPAGATDKAKANCERFKISNPNRIAARVGFAVGGAADSKGGAGAGAEGDAGAFTVQPAALEIPPHEHRYVSVYFHPGEMRSYRAQFTATVEDHPDPAASRLQFQLAGKGTLPCVTLEKPLDLDGDGKVTVDFGALGLGKSRRRPLVLRNDGVVPATALFEMPKADTNFSFAARDSSVTLQPGASKEMAMLFQPTAASKEEEPFTAQIRMAVLHNQYATTLIDLSGRCFVNDLAFEFDDDGDFDDDRIDFGEIDLQLHDEDGMGEGEPAEREVRFLMRSAATETVRFAFPADHPHVRMRPQRGLLPAGGMKEVVAVFATAGPVEYREEPLRVATQRVTFAPGDEGAPAPVVDWDSEKVEVRPASPEEVASWKEKEAAGGDAAASRPPSQGAGGAKKGGKDAKKGAAEVKVEAPEIKAMEIFEDGTAMATVGLPEPATAPVEGEAEKNQEILVSAVADAGKYECDTQQVAFKPTSMFQTRAHTFVVKNTAAIALPFRWSMALNPVSVPGGMTSRPLTMGSRAPVFPNPYSIEPAEGEIAGKGEQRFAVRFAPLEVDDYQYVARALMPTLAPGAAPLRVFLGGRAQRPIVHFDLEEATDYLASRPDALKNELGVPGQIAAPSVRCVEAVSKGTRVRNTRRFHVVNPTAAPYDFVWEAQGEPAPAWRCATPKGHLLPGRRGEMVFEYTPEAVGVAEAFFRFRVPSQGVDELFLFTGRVQDPDIFLDASRLDFKALLLGQVATETVHLVNREHLPFTFAFDRMALGLGPAAAAAPGGGAHHRRPVLDVQPMTGTVPPNGRVPLQVTFCPREEKFHNFNLACSVRKKPR